MASQAVLGDTENLAGGRAWQQSPKLELVSILLTSFVQDQYYRSAETQDQKGMVGQAMASTAQRLEELIAGMPDKKFVAQAALYARREFGMRSISHLAAAQIAKTVKGQEWTKRFFDQIVFRLDDMAEILALLGLGSQPIPNAVKKGFAQAFDRFDSYQIAKYRMETRAVKLVDIVNLVHPKPVEHNAQALHALVTSKLTSTDTWESMLSKAGQLAENDEEKNELKADVWRTLLTSGKLGYFAALRNARNILRQAPDMIKELCAVLTNEKMIRKSLVLPFRYLTAITELEKVDLRGVRRVIAALNKALDISVANVPTLEGPTLIALDRSGSMSGRPWEIGSLFAAILYKASPEADILMFDNCGQYISLNAEDSTLSLARNLPFRGSGTDFRVIFTTANKPYRRIIILSDEQAWIGETTPAAEFEEYCRKFKCNPAVFTWDLQGYGTLQFPEDQVYALSGFSEKAFDIMKLLEKDRQSLVNSIKEVNL